MTLGKVSGELLRGDTTTRDLIQVHSLSLHMLS